MERYTILDLLARGPTKLQLSANNPARGLAYTSTHTALPEQVAPNGRKCATSVTPSREHPTLSAAEKCMVFTSVSLPLDVNLVALLFIVFPEGGAAWQGSDPCLRAECVSCLLFRKSHAYKWIRDCQGLPQVVVVVVDTHGHPSLPS